MDSNQCKNTFKLKAGLKKTLKFHDFRRLEILKDFLIFIAVRVRTISIRTRLTNEYSFADRIKQFTHSFTSTIVSKNSLKLLI